jgi:hypothetical protein
MTAVIFSTSISVCALLLSLYVIFSDRNQKRIDNLVRIQLFLHRDDLSDARRKLREGRVKISLETDEVRRVCSSFDFAGVLAKHNSINKDIFLDYWAAMLVPLEEILTPLADEPSGKGVRVRDYYKFLWWLMKEARARSSKAPN